MLQCSHCAKEFKYESEKKRHEQSHAPQFECKECSKKFSFLSALRRHQKQHERTCSVLCSDCGRSFRDDALLKRHVKYAHKGTHVCSKCGVKFNSELALSSHMKSHKPKSERRFKCSYDGCFKSFNFPHHLKHHELTHTNEKQYSCNVCGKGFIQSHHLKSHLRTHESRNCLNKTNPIESSRKRRLIVHNITADSGISSDSNCDISQDLTKGLISCVECGQMIKVSFYDVHKEKCLRKEEEEPKDLSVKLLPDTEFNNNNTKAEPQFSNCKTILGGCLVSGDSLDNTCPCDQIKVDINYYDIASPITPFNARNEPKTSQTKCIVTLDDNGILSNTCESCDCTTKGHTDKVQLTYVKELADKNIPQIEYRNDGVVKIVDTFDIVITEVVSSLKKDVKLHDSNDYVKLNNFVPYNSCKAVLGKCIVSGNGTMSEECLCAKMAMDDQTNIAQEIDEITPQPNIFTT